MNGIRYQIIKSDKRMEYLADMLEQSDDNCTATAYIFSPAKLVGLSDIKDIDSQCAVFFGRCDQNAMETLSKRHAALFNYNDDELFTAQNAALTAEAALAIIISKHPKALKDMHILIVGFGRIGAALTFLLKKLNANVCVATAASARPALAIADSVVDIHSFDFGGMDVVINTVPTKIIDNESVDCATEGCLYVELASAPALDMEYARNHGVDAASYPALPAKYSPYSAAGVIKDCIERNIMHVLGGD